MTHFCHPEISKLYALEISISAFQLQDIRRSRSLFPLYLFTITFHIISALDLYV